MDRPRPACFVAMPFGRKSPPGCDDPVIDFDRVFAFIESAIAVERLEPVRADVEPGGGFIHKPMYERLLIAEYVVADLTFANANVTYEVGVRHGSSNRPTILIGAADHLEGLPFDFRPLRVMPYTPDAAGVISDEDGAALTAGLRERLRNAAAGRGGVDNPIMQVTSWTGHRLEHDKTDVFLARMDYAETVDERTRAALSRSTPDEAVAELKRIEAQLLDDSEVVTQLHSALMTVYLGYRKHQAWQQMIDIFDRLPRELRATAVAQEQLALALNRIAEETNKEAARLRNQGNAEQAEEARGRAEELRRRALAAADFSAELVTAETWGIRGRIYKGWHDAEQEAGNDLQAQAALRMAIDAYEAGVEADMRDYYPGINAVTLRLLRSTPEDWAELERLVPVVRMAADVAPPAQSVDERYWRAATKLELASAAKDFASAREHLLDMLGLDVDGWMLQTTARNLQIHVRAFVDDAEAVRDVEAVIDALRR